REDRRAKTDRLDTGRLMRAFIGWLRSETDHCSMCAIPTLEEEDDKRPNREHEYLVAGPTRQLLGPTRHCRVGCGNTSARRFLCRLNPPVARTVNQSKREPLGSGLRSCLAVTPALCF